MEQQQHYKMKGCDCDKIDCYKCGQFLQPGFYDYNTPDDMEDFNG